MSSSEHTVPVGVAPRAWRKSSYSGPSNGDCLEVADGYVNVPVRDSKSTDGPVLTFPADGWSSFVTAVRNGSLLA